MSSYLLTSSKVIQQPKKQKEEKRMQEEQKSGALTANQKGDQSVSDLNKLKDKWRGKLNAFLVESAYMACGFDYDRADAALETLMDHHKDDEIVSTPFRTDGEKARSEVFREVKEIAQKQDKGKPRYDLIPGDALHEVVKVLSMGAEKYDDRNWEIGQPWGKVFGAMMRHCWAWWRGEELDKESGLHHMAHAGAEALFLLAYALRKVGGDDRTLNKVVHPPVLQSTKGPGRDFSFEAEGDIKPKVFISKYKRYFTRSCAYDIAGNCSKPKGDLASSSDVVEKYLTSCCFENCTSEVIRERMFFKKEASS